VIITSGPNAHQTTESMLRASEGNLDPETLRRYVEKFSLDDDQRLLQSLIHRADKCRRLLERQSGMSHGLESAFMLRDIEEVSPETRA
jgi:hypothetical protein